MELYVPKGRYEAAETEEGKLLVTSKEDEILKGGYHANKSSPWNLKKLFEILRRLEQSCDGNVTRMSDLLKKAYPHVKEYQREKFYEWYPDFRNRVNDREAARIAKELVWKGIEERVERKLHEMKTVKEITEQLGESETEKAYGITKIPKTRKVMKHISPDQTDEVYTDSNG